MDSPLDDVWSLLDLLRQQRDLLLELREIDYTDFRQNLERQYAVKHALLLAIQITLDTCAHLIAITGGGVPDEYRQLPLALARMGVISDSLAKRLAQAAGFRNRLVHAYRDIALEMVYEFLFEDLGDFDEFLQDVSRFLERMSQDQEEG
ncbi:MAG: DUF86 domain-containing protein [Chloroflexi bacterium]|nr:MAG: DUF86 domain-containing protein [Chloroflexota bacterium]